MTPQVSLTPSEAALQSLAQQVHSSPVMLPEGSGGNQQPATAVICKLIGRATFPNVVMRDLRVQNGGMGTSALQLWKQFSLSTINKTLMEPLTPAEVAFNRESSPDLSKLPKYSIMFSPNVLGEASQMVFVELCNSGHLPTSFSIHLPNERCLGRVLSEPWAHVCSSLMIEQGDRTGALG
jgi:hypothetical protein